MLVQAADGFAVTAERLYKANLEAAEIFTGRDGKEHKTIPIGWDLPVTVLGAHSAELYLKCFGHIERGTHKIIKEHSLMELYKNLSHPLRVRLATEYGSELGRVLLNAEWATKLFRYPHEWDSPEPWSRTVIPWKLTEVFRKVVRDIWPEDAEEPRKLDWWDQG